ncbi:hypothetical protein JHK87_053646 [Glycine soja]|nr:hypothetical protein JHK87_053646 [Glycine soja]
MWRQEKDKGKRKSENGLWSKKSKTVADLSSNRINFFHENDHCISFKRSAETHEDNRQTKKRSINEQGNNRLKEDSMLLMRGFDSVAHTLSLLSNNLDNALHGARELANPPTLTDIFHSKYDKVENKEDSGEKQNEEEESKQGMKRKFDPNDVSEENAVDSQKEENGKKMMDTKIKKAKNLAVSMATKAASLARELKFIKSDLCFMQERCGLLEEENRRLRDGFAKGVRPEEDDLVRLQLEALLAEKSRLANENANLVRENQCLHQLVEYHQLASQDLSDESYEHALQGMYLDFSSPPPTIPEETREFSASIDDGEESTCVALILFIFHSTMALYFGLYYVWPL